MLFATVHIDRTFPRRVILWIRMKLGCMYCKWLPFIYGWFYQKKLTFKAQTVLRSGSYDFDTSRINMVDTWNEKLHPLFHSLTDSCSCSK